MSSSPDLFDDFLSGSPYLVNEKATSALREALTNLSERIDLLRGRGTLSNETLARFFGEKRRLELVAESNAIEGSPLSVGETELAVLRGMTISGKQPKFSDDARNLYAAVEFVAGLARKPESTQFVEVRELHERVLGEHADAGVVRGHPVRISGSDHIPPKTGDDIWKELEAFDAWSQTQTAIPAPIRAAVLHNWLVYIHPFSDGNGRTARSVMNLELIRAGLPSIIVKKKEKERYLTCLHQSDEGDLTATIEFLLEKIDGTLTGLENAAREAEGYSLEAERRRQAQLARLRVFNTALDVFFKLLGLRVDPEAGEGRPFDRASVRFYDEIDLDDYLSLHRRETISRSWFLTIRCAIDGVGQVERLAWIGYRSEAMRSQMPKEGPAAEGPSIYWSRPTGGYPQWQLIDESEPPVAFHELAVGSDEGNQWYCRRGDVVQQLETSAVVTEVVRSLQEAIERGD